MLEAYNTFKLTTGTTFSTQWVREIAWQDQLATEQFLRSHGFVRCDIPACNCGSWHERYGWIERMHEIEDLLTEAGYPLSNDNGNLVRNALIDLITELNTLRASNENRLDK